MRNPASHLIQRSLAFPVGAAAAYSKGPEVADKANSMVPSMDGKRFESRHALGCTTDFFTMNEVVRDAFNQPCENFTPLARLLRRASQQFPSPGAPRWFSPRPAAGPHLRHFGPPGGGAFKLSFPCTEPKLYFSES